MLAGRPAGANFDLSDPVIILGHVTKDGNDCVRLRMKVMGLSSHFRSFHDRFWSEPGRGWRLASARNNAYSIFVTRAISNMRKRGRPATGAIGIYVKLPPADLELLDSWIGENGGEMSRPEAMRRILKLVAGRSGKRVS